MRDCARGTDVANETHAGSASMPSAKRSSKIWERLMMQSSALYREERDMSFGLAALEQVQTKQELAWLEKEGPRLGMDVKHLAESIERAKLDYAEVLVKKARVSEFIAMVRSEIAEIEGWMSK